MTHAKAPILENRDLTDKETALIGWMLANGAAEGAQFLSQLQRARVHSRCPCGCASIDLSIDGKRPTDFRRRVLADFQWQSEEGSLFGAFVFEQDGLLAGLDLWSVDGKETPRNIPSPELLTPFG
jgi:hypothetical protein